MKYSRLLYYALFDITHRKPKEKYLNFKRTPKKKLFPDSFSGKKSDFASLTGRVAVYPANKLHFLNPGWLDRLGGLKIPQLIESGHGPLLVAYVAGRKSSNIFRN